VLPGGLVPLGLAVHAAPAADDALDVLGCAGATDGQQPSFGLRCRHAREGADLRVRELAPGKCLGQCRQRGERARHADLLSGCAEVEANAPGEPFGAGAKTIAPAAAGVELADQAEQAGGGGIEMRGQLGDLVTQAIQLANIHGESPFG
jgi:hypothetical protein